MSKLLDLIKEYRELDIERQIDYEKLYLYSIITHSTAVEGSTVTEVENQLLFDEGISPDKPIEEQFMNLDLKAAYEKGLAYAGEHRDYSIELLCNLSGFVMKNTGSEYNTISGNFSSAAGDLRLLNVTAGRGGKSYMAWQKVPAKLEEFCEWLNSQRNRIEKNDIESIYRLSFLAHYNLVYIHPWADGNGRMARLVMNMIQYEFGLIPTIVRKEKRAGYIDALTKAQNDGNENGFLDFMVKHHCDNLEERIIEYRESVENDTLSFKNDTLNDTLNLSDKERKILSLIKEDEYITISQMVELTSFSRATVNRAISKMQDANILKREGSKKTGSWKLL